MLQILFDASYETIKIVTLATIFTLIFGGPLGLFLEATDNQNIYHDKYLWLHNFIKNIINFFTNIPVFLTLVTLIIIINNIFSEYFSNEVAVATSLGIIGTLFFSKAIAHSLSSLPKELSETAKFLGAEPLQILTKFLIPQGSNLLIKDLFTIIIKLINLSIIASILGSNGLGRVALEQGIQGSQISYLFYVILFGSGLVYIIKLIENLILSYSEKKHHIFG